MSYSGDAAEQVVRLTLEGVEVAAKIAGEISADMNRVFAAQQRSQQNRDEGAR